MVLLSENSPMTMSSSVAEKHGVAAIAAENTIFVALAAEETNFTPVHIQKIIKRIFL